MISESRCEIVFIGEVGASRRTLIARENQIGWRIGKSCRLRPGMMLNERPWVSYLGSEYS